jgi:protein gp37
MADNSGIEWTDATWNPVTGCTQISDGCKHCYAIPMTRRLRAMAQGTSDVGPSKYSEGWAVRTHEDALLTPLRWKKPRRIFVCSMGDLFHEQVPYDFIDKAWAVMAACPQHTFQVLTKRPHRLAEYLKRLGMGRVGYGNLDETMHLWHALRWLSLDVAMRVLTRPLPAYTVGIADRALDAAHSWPLPNVWLGTTVENQAVTQAGWERGDFQWKRQDGSYAVVPGRIDALLSCPAAVRFLSCEPLLGPLDLSEWLEKLCSRSTKRRGPGEICPECGTNAIGRLVHWVICGGESGKGARPLHPDWARSLRDQCQAAGVPFFFKQWGEYRPLKSFSAPEKDELCSRAKLTCALVGSDGKVWDRELWAAVMAAPGMEMTVNVGKKRAGRLLDGRAHNEFPGQVRTPDSSEKITARAVTPGAEEAGNATEEVTPPGGGGNSAPALPSAPPRLCVDKTSPEEETK